MKKNRFFTKLCAILLVMATLLTGIIIPTSAETTTSTEQTETVGTPTLAITNANILLKQNVGVMFAVNVDNVDTTNVVGNLRLLVWTKVADAYTIGTEDAVVSNFDQQEVNGKIQQTFTYTDLSAYQMTDNIYVRAYYEQDGNEYYSNVVKYSVLKYSIDARVYYADDEKLMNAIEAMLNYGAAVQIYADYNTDFLANGEFSMIKAQNAVLEDGFSHGIFAPGTEVKLTANVPEDKLLHNWVTNEGEKIFTSDATKTITAKAPEVAGETANYKAELVGKSANGNFVYELDAVTVTGDAVYTTAAPKVDGELDSFYTTHGYMIPSMNKANGKTGETTFDLYFYADAHNVYFYYDFDKCEKIFYDQTYLDNKLYQYYLDCIDFLVKLDGTEAWGNEFYIMAGAEGFGNSKANYGAQTNYVSNFYVKHAEVAEGEAPQDYAIEFAIPLSKVTGTDENGNKKLTFTAMSTVTTAWGEINPDEGGVWPTTTEGWPDAQKPKRSYKSAYNAIMKEGNDYKRAPSTIIINVPEAEEQAPATAPIIKGGMNGDEFTNDVYEISKDVSATFVVDGKMEESYKNGIHQVPVGSFPIINDSTFDVYITADATHIYVFYEFTKAEQIFVAPNTTDMYMYDCVDFVLNVAGTKKYTTVPNDTNAHEFRIAAGIEGGKGTAMASGPHITNGVVDDYYVEHTFNGYNIEFSIPLSKVTGADANGNPQISFTALSTISEYAVNGAPPSGTGRQYTTATNTLNYTQNAAKQYPNLLTIKDTGIAATPSKTLADGRYSYTLNAGKEALTVDGEMDGAYASGLTWKAKYELVVGHTHEKHFTTPKNNTFTLHMTADADYVYLFYVVFDEKIVGASAASDWYRGDCADLIFSKAAKATEGTGADIRIFGDIEGGLGKADARDTNKAPIVDLYVKHTSYGYNVEIKIDRAQFTNKNVFSFLAMAGMCPTTKEETGTSGVSVYPCIDNGASKSGNDAKGKLNEVVIVDAQ